MHPLNSSCRASVSDPLSPGVPWRTPFHNTVFIPLDFLNSQKPSSSALGPRGLLPLLENKKDKSKSLGSDLMTIEYGVRYKGRGLPDLV